MSIDITKQDNAADTVIHLTISGNRLVSILNAVQAMMYETGRQSFNGNERGFISPSYAELDETIERVRDQLSEQRCAKRT